MISWFCTYLYTSLKKIDIQTCKIGVILYPQKTKKIDTIRIIMNPLEMLNVYYKINPDTYIIRNYLPLINSKYKYSQLMS